MRKRQNPKIVAMKQRAILLENERQNLHTPNFYLNEQTTQDYTKLQKELLKKYYHSDKFIPPTKSVGFVPSKSTTGQEWWDMVKDEGYMFGLEHNEDQENFMKWLESVGLERGDIFIDKGSFERVQEKIKNL